MLRRGGLVLFIFICLPCSIRASDGKSSPALRSSAAPPSGEPGTPALFSWGDVDGDGRLDLAAVGLDGRLQLLVGAGEDRFDDVTVEMGLAGIENAALALWADYDGDGRADLFIGARSGSSRLYRNEGGRFVDMTEASGLASAGAVQFAQWLDHDGDGRADLFLATERGSELFRGLEGGFFAAATLPTLAGPAMPGVPASVPADLSDVPVASNAAEEADERSKSVGVALADGVPTRAHPVSTGSMGSPASQLSATMLPFAIACASSVRDQANPASCVQASTTPVLGKLYPISSNLFVAVGGDVGIGTTSPSARLHVAGTARVTDTLTLAPSSDMALDVSTGSIYKGGALFIHTKGVENTAIGYNALSNTEGYANTASGYKALYSNDGDHNTASGFSALHSNTGGSFNVASGSLALRYNTTGSRNTACGLGALEHNTSAGLNTAVGFLALNENSVGNYDTAVGAMALVSNTTGAYNTACGNEALFLNTSGSYNTAIGYRALASSYTADENTAVGADALGSITTGARNIALGSQAGASLTTGSNNIMIGNVGALADGATIRIGSAQTRTFISGIRGVTTGNANAVAVLVDSAGQLGTVSSSRRFKEHIADMGERTERLLELRPVVFHYKQEQTLPEGGELPLEYGLIAEEVAEVFPELVVHDDEGKPFTVKYHLLSTMLLNELQALHERVATLEERLSTTTTGRR